MAKYHIKADGTPGICRAQQGNCPYGGDSEHYSSAAAAEEAAQIKLEKEYGVNGEEKSLSDRYEALAKINDEMAEESYGLEKHLLSKQSEILRATAEQLQDESKFSNEELDNVRAALDQAEKELAEARGETTTPEPEPKETIDPKEAKRQKEREEQAEIASELNDAASQIREQMKYQSDPKVRKKMARAADTLEQRGNHLANGPTRTPEMVQKEVDGAIAGIRGDLPSDYMTHGDDAPTYSDTPEPKGVTPPEAVKVDKAEPKPKPAKETPKPKGVTPPESVKIPKGEKPTPPKSEQSGDKPKTTMRQKSGTSFSSTVDTSRVPDRLPKDSPAPIAAKGTSAKDIRDRNKALASTVQHHSDKRNYIAKNLEAKDPKKAKEIRDANRRVGEAYDTMRTAKVEDRDEATRQYNRALVEANNSVAGTRAAMSTEELYNSRGVVVSNRDQGGTLGDNMSRGAAFVKENAKNGSTPKRQAELNRYAERLEKATNTIKNPPEGPKGKAAKERAIKDYYRVTKNIKKYFREVDGIDKHGIDIEI